MRIEVRIDVNQKEPRVVIVTDQITPEIQHLLQQLNPTGILQAYDGRQTISLDLQDVFRIYSQQQKVYCQTKFGTYLLHARLYELEEQLAPQRFLRISNAEIVNSRKIRRLDASLAGTIVVHMEGDIQTYASRRYVPKIKKFFGLGGK